MHTDRVYVAIAAAKLNKRTYVYRGGCAQTVAKYSLSTLANVRSMTGSRYERLVHRYMGVAYVTSLNDVTSRKRLKVFNRELASANLPIAKLNAALHFHRDLKTIRSKYPYIREKSPDYEMRPGAYGLAASFVQFLHKAILNDYTMYYEDDASLPRSKTQFSAQLLKALESLPNRGNDVYSFSTTSYCRGCPHEERWLKRKQHMGTTALLFTKSGARAVLAHLIKKGTGRPIDKLLNSLSKKGVIRGWDWGGNVVAENPMFCGLFKQTGVHCNKSRPGNLMGVKKR